MDCERMSKVIRTRSYAAARRLQPLLAKQGGEDVLDRSPFQRPSVSINEQVGAITSRPDMARRVIDVMSDLARQIRAERHNASTAFAFSDSDYVLMEIDIADQQPPGLSEAQPCAIQDKHHRSDGDGGYFCGVVSRLRCSP